MIKLFQQWTQLLFVLQKQAIFTLLWPLKQLKKNWIFRMKELVSILFKQKITDKNFFHIFTKGYLIGLHLAFHRFFRKNFLRFGRYLFYFEFIFKILLGSSSDYFLMLFAHLKAFGYKIKIIHVKSNLVEAIDRVKKRADQVLTKQARRDPSCGLYPIFFSLIKKKHLFFFYFMIGWSFSTWTNYIFHSFKNKWNNEPLQINCIQYWHLSKW